MQRTIASVVFLVTASSCATAARAADGDLDPTFQGDGRWADNVPTIGRKVAGVAPDGRLLIGYTSSSGAGTNSAMRFIPVPDQGVANWCGQYHPSLGGTNEDVLGDMKVVGNRVFLAGRAAGPPGDPDSQIAVGAVDLETCDLVQEFGGADGYLGASSTPLDTAAIDFTSNGRARIAVEAGPAGDRRLIHYGIASNGVADAAYEYVSVDFVTAFGALSFEPQDQFRQPNGKTLVVGNVLLPGGDIDVGVVRFDSGGVLDETFSIDGIAAFSYDVVDSGYDRAYAVAALPDGRIVIAGSVERPDRDRAAIAILTGTGGYYNAFGTIGRYSFDFEGGGSSSALLSLAIQGNERIVAAGYSSWSILGDFAVARFLPTGSQPLDASFAADGKRLLDFDLGGPGDYGESVTLEQGGRITVVGTVQTVNNNSFGAARFENSYIFADGFEWGLIDGWSSTIDG